MMIFKRIQTTSQALSQYVDFMRICFPHTNIFNLQYMTWLYLDNPLGAVIGFDAWDKGRLVAHYACIPKQIKVNGVLVRAILSLNTATHVDYRGQKLFTKLADMTYELASDEGYGVVFGVSNANSTPGLVNKLGFQLVSPLEARLGIGSLNIDLNSIEEKIQFKTVWSNETINWRCGNPNNVVYKRYKAGRVMFYAPAIGCLPVYAEYLPQNFDLSYQALDEGLLFSIRLFIGLFPEGVCSFRNYYSIPQKLRPSPLNFIYRSLDQRVTQLDRKSIYFSFLDFDAY